MRSLQAFINNSIMDVGVWPLIFGFLDNEATPQKKLNNKLSILWPILNQMFIDRFTKSDREEKYRRWTLLFDKLH